MGDIAGIVSALASVAGTVGNMENANEQAALRKQIANRQFSQEQNLVNASSPASIAAGTSALEQPLSKDLLNSIGRAVANQQSSQGIQGAPGLFQDVLAQALAPYYLQQQDSARSAYLQGLGLQQGATGMLPQSPGFGATSANPAAPFAAFLQSKQFKDLMGGNKGLAPDSAAYSTPSAGDQMPSDPNLTMSLGEMEAQDPWPETPPPVDEG